MVREDRPGVTPTRSVDGSLPATMSSTLDATGALFKSIASATEPRRSTSPSSNAVAPGSRPRLALLSQ